MSTTTMTIPDEAWDTLYDAWERVNPDVGEYHDHLRSAAMGLLLSEPGSVSEASWTQSVYYWSCRIASTMPGQGIDYRRHPEGV